MRPVESVDAVADAVTAAAARVAPPGNASLASELIARAAAIGAGRSLDAGAAPIPRDLRAALRACEVRARRLGGWSEGAAVDFLGDAIATLVVEHRLEPGEARAALVAAADEIGLPRETVVFAVFRRA